MRKFLQKEDKNSAVNNIDQEFENQWLEPTEEEGQLSVDVYQKNNNLIVKSTIAGAKPEDIEVAVNGDTLIIKGSREIDDEIEYQDYLYRECYWGKFSRTILLPCLIVEDKIKADYKNGILTITMPKVKESDHVIKVKQKK